MAFKLSQTTSFGALHFSSMFGLFFLFGMLLIFVEASASKTLSRSSFLTPSKGQPRSTRSPDSSDTNYRRIDMNRWTSDGLSRTMPSCAELRQIFMYSINQMADPFAASMHSNTRINPFAFVARTSSLPFSSPPSSAVTSTVPCAVVPDQPASISSSSSTSPSPSNNPQVSLDSTASLPNKRERPLVGASTQSDNLAVSSDIRSAPNLISSNDDFAVSRQTAKRKLIASLKTPDVRNFGKFYSASSLDDEIGERPDRSLDVIEESPAFYFSRPVNNAKLSDFWSEGTWHAPIEKPFYRLRTWARLKETAFGHKIKIWFTVFLHVCFSTDRSIDRLIS